MKYLFILLAIVNIGYWSWHSFISGWLEPENPAEQTIALNPSEPPIKLLAEAQQTTPTDSAPTAESDQTPEAVATEAQPASTQSTNATVAANCYSIASTNHALYSQTTQWASQQGIAVNEQPLPPKAIRDYRAWIPPQASRADAQAILAQLKEQSIDSFIINSGAEKNGISLGVFGREKEAERMVAFMKKKGYSAEIKPRYRGSVTHSAVLGSQGKGVSSAQLNSLKQQYPEINMAETACK